MKKYLMTGIAAVAMCAAFTSCSKDKDIEVLTQEQIEKAKYEAAFIKRFGQPAANQDWGFSKFAAKSARTRSIIKETHELPAGLTFPTLKSFEADEVMRYFRSDEGDNSVGLDISKFFIVYVGGSQTVNVWSSWDNSVKTENVVLDYLHINGEHVNDWNSNHGAARYIYDSKANNFRARNSYLVSSETLTTTKWKLAQITLSDGEVGYYVGLSAYGRKNETEEKYQLTDYDRENYYDDWVFKIVPAETEVLPDADVRVIAEDLTEDENGDFDFNDVVFDVVYNYSSTESAIIIQAAGGIYPIYVDGHEAHQALGVNTNVMVNTGNGTRSAKPKLIPLGKKISTAYSLPVQVDKGNGLITLDADPARAPHKIAVVHDFKWCDERDDIERVYKKFPDWVKDPNVEWWH